MTGLFSRQEKGLKAFAKLVLSQLSYAPINSHMQTDG